MIIHYYNDYLNIHSFIHSFTPPVSLCAKPCSGYGATGMELTKTGFMSLKCQVLNATEILLLTCGEIINTMKKILKLNNEPV